jgi:hypothetical protein
LSAAFGAAELEAGTEDVAAGAAVATTLFRAIGRGFGSGTFGAPSAGIENATASARHVAKAVDRNAAERTVRVTTFLRGESFKAEKPQSYLIEYVDEILTDPFGPALCAPIPRQNRGCPVVEQGRYGPFAATSDPI